MSIRLGKKPETTIERQTLSGQEAARYLGVGYNTLKRLVKEGEIRCRTIGTRAYLFSRKELDRWINFDQPDSTNG